MTRLVAPVQPPQPRALAAGGGTRRTVHPLAWWAWAMLAAGVASVGRNPLLLALVAAAVLAVVLLRRSNDPWARSVAAYFVLAAAVLGIRLFFQLLVGGLREGHVLFTLPEIALPRWAAGIRLGGPVTAEALYFTFTDAGRLAVLLLCVGAANALANPRRALKSVPPALHEVSVAVVIALAMIPQLVESAQRVRRARRLRGGASTGLRAIGAIAVPVIADAVERSIDLAAGMESRGFGHRRPPQPGTSTALLVAMNTLAVGIFLLLGGFDKVPPFPIGPFPVIGVLSATQMGVIGVVIGIVITILALLLSGRRHLVTRYRPDRWATMENAVVLAGMVALLATLWLAQRDPLVLNTGYSTLGWPTMHPVFLLAAILLAIPVIITPAPRPMP